MGFSGTFIVHRGRSLLEELLPRIEPFRDAILCYEGVCGAWQVTRVFAGASRLPPDLLVALREVTGAPVLVADIIDSDAALVRGLGWDIDWTAWLHPKRALAFLAPALRSAVALKAAGPGDAATAALAIAWAHEAGLRPRSLAEVTAILNGERGSVEARLFDLLNLLGLATDDVTAPEPPAPVDVFRRWLGHCLASVDLVAHRPVRGERLNHTGMPDLRLRFSGLPPVTACACTDSFFFRPDRPAEQPAALGVVAQAPDQPLHGAATVRQGFLAALMGVVLRFADGDLYLAAVNGVWVAAFGPDGFQRRLRELGGADARLNAWIT